MTNGSGEDEQVGGSTGESYAKSAMDVADPLGFAGLGDFFPKGVEKVYVRKRLRPSLDPVLALSQEVERLLGPLVGKGGDTLPSVGSFARAGLSRLETVKTLVRTLPEDQQAEVAKLVVAAWQGGQHQTIALLRDGGWLNAKRGFDLAVRMKTIRANNRLNAELLHPTDRTDLPKMKALIEAAAKAGKKLSERDAARQVLFPNLPDIPRNAAGSKKRREIESMRNRYRRWKNRLGR